MRYWLGVVSKEHVLRGVGLGIAQLGHGKRAPLARLQPEDWLVYYSSRQSYAGGAPLKAFTAIGQVMDAEIWQEDEGGFKPWRRRLTYRKDAVETNLADLADDLELTSGPSWGYALRRGLLPLSQHDFERIRTSMQPT